MLRLAFAIIATAFLSTAHAAAVDTPTDVTVGDDFVTADEILNRSPDDTQCATAVFANALAENAAQVSSDAHENVVQQWIRETFARGDVLRTVLACPEFANAADDDMIKLLPITYTFPNGREISVNYETQPRILKQRARLADRAQMPGGGASPRIGSDGAQWTNTDPAWYAIMVAQHGALDAFAAAGTNHTISVNYIRDNIDDLYPKNGRCTSRSAFAGNRDIVNLAMHDTVGLGKEDSNDYYVAGDINLQWISYLEIGLDVAITILTVGGGTVILGVTKAARASRVLKNLTTTIRTLSKSDKVMDYIRVANKYGKLGEELKKLDRATDAVAYEKKVKEMAELSRTMREMEAASEDVAKYRKAIASFKEINKYRNALRGIHNAKRGNIVVRAWRGLRAANTGGKAINKGARIARSSAASSRVRDWLFNSTLQAGGMLARMERQGGLIYGALKFVGGMYDWTETTTDEYTSGVEFAPLLLLSADDLDGGQDNVVNHGMWLMWLGDSTSAADDDAAYLQAMDTAEKFWQDLNAVQERENVHACDVDIYVVRPILRNPGTDNAELYYLIMNDIPWTTHPDDE